MSNTITATAPTSVAPKESEQPVKKSVEFEDDDLVTVLLRGWNAFDPKTHQPLIRTDQVTYVDNSKFTGGVGRSISYAQAKKWVKHGLIAKEHIFPNHAQADEFSVVMGRNPITAEGLAGAIASLSPEKAAAILGDKAALTFAKSLQALVSGRAKDNNE